MSSSGVLKHLRNYASAGLLSALVGVVTFPILTRNLSVENYGILGLITASVTFFIAVGKLGVQQAVIRFFSQVRHSNMAYSMSQLNSTVIIVFLVLATVTTLAWLFTGFQILPRWVGYEGIGSLFEVAAGVVFIKMLGSGILNFLRAQQRSGVVAGTLVVGRLANLFFIVSLLLFSELDPRSVLFCLLMAEIISVSYSAWHYRRDFQLRLEDVCRPLARAMFIYGMPLMILESMGLILRLSDRYLIEGMLGVVELGQYSASYNLVVYLDVIVLASLVQAIKPMYMHLWESEGAAQTAEFLSRGFHVYLVIGIPFVALFSLTSPYLLSFLAGGKYNPGMVIIPFITLSILIDGCVHFLAAGLYIRKDTRAMMIWAAIAAVVNLLLNLVFIPIFGIIGAAVVTVLSYLLFVVGVTRLSFRHVSFPVPLLIPGIMTVASLVVYAMLVGVDLHSDLFNLFGKGIIGLALLLGVLLMIDREMRGHLQLMWRPLARIGK